jgi:hypothetical protein
MTCQQYPLKGTSTTLNSTPAPIFNLHNLPANGAFTVQGQLIARSQTSGLEVTYSPTWTGTIINGVITQTGGTGNAAPCDVSPSDGGATQGFAPAGVLAGEGAVSNALSINGTVASVQVTGLSQAITWS